MTGTSIFHELIGVHESSRLAGTYKSRSSKKSASWLVALWRDPHVPGRLGSTMVEFGARDVCIGGVTGRNWGTPGTIGCEMGVALAQLEYN